LQRIEGNEGIDLRPKRKEIVEELDDEPQMIANVITTADNLAARKRGRPKKI
jgi:hypothetical protein